MNERDAQTIVELGACNLVRSWQRLTPRCNGAFDFAEARVDILGFFVPEHLYLRGSLRDAIRIVKLGG